MARTKTITLYPFSELSDDVKGRVLDRHRAINVSYAWWGDTYEDAANIGLKITSFGLDRSRHARGEFIGDAEECAHKITEEHGEGCETRKTAEAYLAERGRIIDAAERDEDGEFADVFALDAELDDADAEFLKSLLEDYSIMLQQEWEYLQGDEAVRDTIEANEWEFTEDGTAA